MVQNYQYFNNWTIKNNYPLPLILDLINSIGKKKKFTKIYLRWRYNNIRIKEEDEQKAVFLIPEGIFEPTVMFFGLTNSLVTFQTMINDLLRDMIETEDIAAFIDDVIVGIETKERHDEIVKKCHMPSPLIWKTHPYGTFLVNS